MSSLIFCTDENQVLVATDTLATSPDGSPFKFTTKAFIVPHLKLMIAGTGAGGFLGRWFVHINDGMAVKGIDHLDCFAPNSLASLWAGYKQQQVSLPNDITVTVYHFGFSETSKLIHSFAYRSMSDFRSNRLEYGVGLKPDCHLPDNYCFPRDIRKMMDEQRTIQASNPKSDRVYIGGEIEIHHLSENGFQVYTMDRFEDYARDETAIYDNFRASNPHET